MPLTKRFGGLITTTRGKRARLTPMMARSRKAPRKYSAKKLKYKLRTRTKTKVHQRARPLPNRSGSESTYNINHRARGFNARVNKGLRDNTFTRNEPFLLTGSAGQSQVNLVTTMFSPADIQSMLTVAESQNHNTVANATTNVFLKSCYGEIMIQNSTNAVCRVQIWNSIPKRDIYQGLTASPNTPDLAWQQGLKEQTASGTGGEYLVVGSRPTDSRFFNDYHRVGKVTYIDLAPGQVHYHRIRYKINRFMSQEMLAAYNLYSLKGMTLNTMIVAYGEPMVDNTGIQTTTSATSLHVIGTKTYHFSYNMSNASISTNADNLAKTSGANLENLVTGASAAFAAVT